MLDGNQSNSIEPNKVACQFNASLRLDVNLADPSIKNIFANLKAAAETVTDLDFGDFDQNLPNDFFNSK